MKYIILFLIFILTSCAAQQHTYKTKPQQQKIHYYYNISTGESGWVIIYN